MAEPSALPDKREIAASFSRAAASYDSVAALQRAVGAHLLTQLPASLSVVRWLDVGCGTGHFSRALAARFPQAEGCALDIAEGMLRHARAHGGATHFIGGDAEALPLAAASQSLIFSSLALQWCADFSRVLAEARRVLAPGGVLAFSSLCAGTLHELRESWRTVDGFNHVNRFRPLAEYQQLCAASGLRVVQLSSELRVLHYGELRELTHELKGLGAHNLNPGRPGGLTGRARLLALREAYEHFRQPAGLPARWQLVYGILQKEDEA